MLDPIRRTRLSSRPMRLDRARSTPDKSEQAMSEASGDPPQAAPLPQLASRHARGRSAAGPVRRAASRGSDASAARPLRGAARRERRDLYDWISGRARAAAGARQRRAAPHHAASASRPPGPRDRARRLLRRRPPTPAADSPSPARPRGTTPSCWAAWSRAASCARCSMSAATTAAWRALGAALAFFHPGLEVLTLPAWDCLPYDRVSPNPEIVSRRIDALTRLAAAARPIARIVLTTVNAALQRVPPRRLFADRVLTLGRWAARCRSTGSSPFSSATAISRTDTVREAGEFAVRGGIVDLFPSGAAEPVRLDFFGDTIEGMRVFDPLDPAHHRHALEPSSLRPVSEVLLDDAAIHRFRSRYREQFGTVADDDPLYESRERRPALHRHGALAAALLRDAWRRSSITCRMPAVTLDHAGRGGAHRPARARSPISTRRAQGVGRPRAVGGAGLSPGRAGAALSRRRRNGARALAQRRVGAVHALRRAGRRARSPPMPARARAAISPRRAPSRRSISSTRCATTSATSSDAWPPRPRRRL